MDKFMSSTWFVRIASFAIAALLFISVNFELNSDKKSIEFSTSPELDTIVIEDVPVEVYYDTENLVVTGIPENVDVTLKGAKSLLTAAKNQRDFKVYVDLSDPNITLGKRTVTFKISDLNDKIVATVNPESVQVNIQEKVTKEFSVTPEYNHSYIEDGYIAEQPKASPEMVMVTGAKETIDKIAYVKAFLDLNDIVKETVSGRATVRALDQNLNKLDVSIEPSNVFVTLKVSIPDKTVKVVPVQKGKVPDGIKIKKITVDPAKVTLYGKAAVLDKIDKVNLDVDVSNVKDDTEVELALPKMDNVKAMSLENVKVKIDVDKLGDTEASLSSKKLNNLSIEIQGMTNNQSVSIEPKTMDITLFGATQDLNEITASDIALSVDVSNLTVGQHNVPVTVKAPTAVEWQLASSNAIVGISNR